MAYDDLGGDPTGQNSLNNSLYNSVNPNFMNLNAAELNQSKYIKSLAKKNQELVALGDKGRDYFKKLDPSIQDGLRWYHTGGEQPKYLEEEKNLLQSVSSTAFELAKNFNPLVWLYRGVTEYGNRLNQVLNVAANATVNNAPVFDKDVWQEAYENGESLYDNERLVALKKKHGDIKTFIAKQHLAGRSRAEMIANYGSLDEDFLAELASFDADRGEWENGILEEFRQAKLSWGRIYARELIGSRTDSDSVLNKIYKNLGIKPESLSQDARDKMFSYASGYTDAMTQIFADPLTYVTMGGGAGVRFAGKAIGEVAKVQDLVRGGSVGITKAFDSSPRLRQYWDTLGPKIKEYNNAREAKDSLALARILDEVKYSHPMHSRVEDLEALKGIENADTAKDFFLKAENASLIISGRTRDLTFYRHTTPVAKRFRLNFEGVRTAWYKFGSRQFATSDEERKFLSATINDIVALGEDVSREPIESLDALRAAEKESRRASKKIFNLLSKSAGDQPIYLGEEAYKSVDTLTAVLQNIMPANLARGVALNYLAAPVNQQFVMLRGIYKGVMQTMGVDKTIWGKTFMEEVLDNFDTEIEKFNFQKGTSFPAHFPNANQQVALAGPVADKNLTLTVSNLPWTELQTFAADAAFLTGGKSRGAVNPITRAIAFAGGATNNHVSREFVNFWSLGTLFPKLGIRSGIDEGFIFYLTAPREVVFNTIQARYGSQVITAFTGQKTAIGPISNTTRKILSKIPGLKKLDVTGMISLEARNQYIDALRPLVNSGKMTEAEARDLYRQSLSSDVLSGFRLLSDENKYFTQRLLMHSPNFFDSAAARIGKTTGLNGRIAEGLDAVFDDDILRKRMFDDFQIKAGNDFNLIDPRKLDIDQRIVVQFDAFRFGFYNNTLGGLDMGWVFSRNNFLRSRPDVIKAIDEVVKYLDTNPAIGQKVISERAASIPLQKAGLTNTEIFREMASAMFADMYVRFHGSDKKFNYDLASRIASKMGDVKTGKDFQKVIGSIDLEEYGDDVVDNLIDKEFYSRIDSFTTLRDVTIDYSKENMFVKGQRYAFDLMDRTNTGLTRQPIVKAWYYKYSRDYMKMQNAYEQKVFKNLYNEALEARGGSITPEYAVILRKRAQSVSEKMFTTLAATNALNATLKYVDNPHVRTNLANSLRGISRFYRATEDFYRRVYRLTSESPLRAIYRMRLLSSGLHGTGIIERDEEGNEYIVVPMDNIIFGHVDGILRTLFGESPFKTPQGSAAVARVTSMNPSFQDDAGIPYLSGPVGALSTLALKSIAGQLFEGEAWVEDIDNALLGDIGDNLDLRKAIVPAFLDRIYKALDNDDKSQHNYTAALQALAYTQAYGSQHPGSKPGATPQEIDDFLNQVRISAHNIVVANTLLGTVLPFSTNLQETGQLPEYMREAGDISIRSEYFEILDAIMAKYGNTVSDPFELAAAIYVGKNPNKLIYTVSRENKNIKPYVQKTVENRNWIINNKKFIDTYGDAAYLFSPNVGEINTGVYNWMRAAGLVENIELETYLRNMQIVKDKQRYFSIEDTLNEQLANTVDPQQRRVLINKATAQRDALKKANPLLNAALTDQGFNINEETELYNNLQKILEDQNSPITKANRKKAETMLLVFNKAYKSIIGFNDNNIDGFGPIKKAMRDRTLEELENIAGVDRFSNQLLSLIFKPMLKFHVRNVPSSQPSDSMSFTGNNNL